MLSFKLKFSFLVSFLTFIIFALSLFFSTPSASAQTICCKSVDNACGAAASPPQCVGSCNTTNKKKAGPGYQGSCDPLGCTPEQVQRGECAACPIGYVPTSCTPSNPPATTPPSDGGRTCNQACGPNWYEVCSGQLTCINNRCRWSHNRNSTTCSLAGSKGCWQECSLNSLDCKSPFVCALASDGKNRCIAAGQPADASCKLGCWSTCPAGTSCQAGLTCATASDNQKRCILSGQPANQGCVNCSGLVRSLTSPKFGDEISYTAKTIANSNPGTTLSYEGKCTVKRGSAIVREFDLVPTSANSNVFSPIKISEAGASYTCSFRYCWAGSTGKTCGAWAQ